MGRQSVGNARPPEARAQSTPAEGRVGSGNDAGRLHSGDDTRLAGGGIDGRRGQEHRAAPSVPVGQRHKHEGDVELLREKEQTIAELEEMVTIMKEKILKLEQLVRIKDSKIEAMSQKLQKYGLT